MPKEKVRLFVEEYGRDPDETFGAPCSHILKNGPKGPFGPPEPNLEDEYIRHPISRCLIADMGIIITALEEVVYQWDESYIGVRFDKPDAEMSLPEGHSAYLTEAEDAQCLLEHDLLFLFSTSSFAINLLPGLIWYAKEEYPNGYFVTTMINETVAASAKCGTPLKEIIDIPALSGYEPVIDCVRKDHQGRYEIHLQPL